MLTVIVFIITFNIVFKNIFVVMFKISFQYIKYVNIYTLSFFKKWKRLFPKWLANIFKLALHIRIKDLKI